MLTIILYYWFFFFNFFFYQKLKKVYTSVKQFIIHEVTQIRKRRTSRFIF